MVFKIIESEGIKINYYDHQHKAFLYLDALLKKCENPVMIEIIYLDVTNKYPVSLKSIKDRIQMLKKIEKITIKNGEVKWNQE